MKVCYFRTYKCRIFKFLVTYFQFSCHGHQGVQNREGEGKLLPFIQRPWNDIRVNWQFLSEVMFLYTLKQQSSHAKIFSTHDDLARSKEELSYITEILFEDKSKA